MPAGNRPDLQDRLAKARARKIRTDEELAQLRVEARSRSLNDDELEHQESLEREAEKLRDEMESVTQSIARVGALADAVRGAAPGSAVLEDGVDLRSGGDADRSRDPSSSVRDQALRALEARSGEMAPADADRIDSLIRRDRTGADARYIIAVANEHYISAFERYCRDPQTAHLRFDGAEVEAMRATTAATEYRDMLAGIAAQGGLALPFTLDASVNLVGSGAISPLREISRLRTITTHEIKLVNSAGIVAAYAPESTEVGDNSPSLTQPTAVPERFHAFVPASLELTQDWGALAEELRSMFADAVAVLESEKFLRGSGIDEPEGLLTGLGPTEEVLTAAVTTFAAEDAYALAESVPARWRGRSTFIASLPIIFDARRFAGPGSTEPEVVNEALDRMVGRPLRELSTMDSTIVGDKKILVCGDFGQFSIVDRIGQQVQVIGALFGPNQRPTGQAGFYLFGRNTSVVQTADAFRVLDVRGAGS